MYAQIKNITDFIMRKSELNMKHFRCVHHWNNEETKKRVREMLDEQPMTDRQFLGIYEGEKAKALQHWGGRR